jgi:hypothetical protein
MITPSRNGAVWTALAVLALTAGLARAEKGLNDGVYRDRSDKSHPWSIQRSHLLMWNDQPYAPAGVVFHSAYLQSPTSEHLAADQAELDRLKAVGITDLWIEPGRGLLETTIEQTQAIVDAVEQRGFRYGLRVGDRAREPLIGYSPSLPSVHVPVSRLQPGARETWTVNAPRGRRVFYALVDQPNEKNQNWAVATGEAVVERDQARIDLQIRNTRLLGKVPGRLLVVPEVQVEPEALGSFGDLWGGMQAYGIRLKKHLQSVKFGPGLRFVLDPFSAGDGTVGLEDTVFPTSEAFRTAFRDWLKRRGGIPTLNTHWRTNDQRIPSFEEAGRLVPMWPKNDPPDGDAWLFDPVEKSVYRVVARQCNIWGDLEAFRAESLKRWMNTLCTSLRQEGLNVPMLFTWSTYHPIFINSPSPAGYDGLGAQFYAAPGDMARDAAYALGQAEEADRNTWLIAARLAGPPDADGRPTPLADAGQIRQAWQSLRGAGFRGVFLDPKQLPNAVPLAKDLQAALAAEGPALQEKVKTLFFPAPLAIADRVTRLPNGVWWLPSGLPAKLLRFGESIIGYEIDKPFGDEHVVRKGTVIWSVGGKQPVSFFDDKLFPVEFHDSAGVPLKLKSSKYQYKTILTEEPLVVSGADSAMIFPLELASEQLLEFDQLLLEAERQRLPSAQFRSIFDQAEKALSPGSAAAIYRTITPYVERLRQELTPFLWLEGERSNSHTFTGIAFQAGASGGTYLKLDQTAAPASGFFKARYVFEVRRDTSYEFWLAGRLPGRPGASPLIWAVDDEPAVPVNQATPVGADYSPGMAWTLLGRLTLKQGLHELTLIVPGPAPDSGGRFRAAIDALVISRDGFKPNGIERPATRTLFPLPPRPEKGKKGDKNDKDSKDGKDPRGEKKG